MKRAVSKIKAKMSRRERTFHRSWRGAWGGECVNIGEGPFARLIKGLDAERVRGRLIKPLDFVCVAWSFIQGYKSAMTGTWRPREKRFNERQVNMTNVRPFFFLSSLNAGATDLPFLSPICS